jgi:signal transduction histidine kinase
VIQRVKRLLGFIGPYPYNPYLIFLFFFAFFFSRFVSLLAETPPGLERTRNGIVLILIALIPGSFFAALAVILQRYRFWSSSNLFFYILEITTAAGVLELYGPLINPILEKMFDYRYVAPISLSKYMFLMAINLTLIAFALMHKAERKIIDRLEKADGLVERLTADREGLVNLDEAIRRQTSTFLHDRVQSDLMVVGMKLKSIQESASDEINEVIKLAIARLENTRSEDLKNIIQVLSPNFEASELKGSFESLIMQYESNMAVTIRVDSTSEELDSHYLLGTYRIVEQGLLNAFVHGPANNVFVSVSTDLVGKTEILISDDGPGTDLDFVDSGVGTAVIDSWVGILNGKKTIETVPGHGYLLRVLFPLKVQI